MPTLRRPRDHDDDDVDGGEDDDVVKIFSITILPSKLRTHFVDIMLAHE